MIIEIWLTNQYLGAKFYPNMCLQAHEGENPPVAASIRSETQSWPRSHLQHWFPYAICADHSVRVRGRGVTSICTLVLIHHATYHMSTLVEIQLPLATHPCRRFAGFGWDYPTFISPSRQEKWHQVTTCKRFGNESIMIHFLLCWDACDFDWTGVNSPHLQSDSNLPAKINQMCSSLEKKIYDSLLNISPSSWKYNTLSACIPISAIDMPMFDESLSMLCSPRVAIMRQPDHNFELPSIAHIS